MNSSPSPMETKPGETEISSLRDFSNHVANLCSNSAAVWFRGARKASYGLVPSLYRHSIKKSAEELRQFKSDLMGTLPGQSPAIHISDTNSRHGDAVLDAASWR